MRKTVVICVSVGFLLFLVSGFAFAQPVRGLPTVRGGIMFCPTMISPRESTILPDVRLHWENYLLLLAEKYAPEIVEEWKAEIARRDSILEDMQREEWFKRRFPAREDRIQELRERLTNMRRRREEKDIDLRELRREMMESFRFRPSIRERLAFPLVECHMDTFMVSPEILAEFHRAVREEDEEALRDVLTLLAERYRLINDLWETKLKLRNLTP